MSVRRMLFLGALCAVVLVASGSAVDRSRVVAQAPGAVADLKDAAGRPVGRATFTPSGGGLWIHVEVSGLAPGPHGIHIHANGRCEGPAFDSAGGHFNPGGHKHGLANPAGPHEGDLPNLIASQSGKARFDAADFRVTLDAGPAAVLRPGGTSLVIHAMPDDEMSDPAGNSGARVVCGVITP